MPFKCITGTKASATDFSAGRYKFVDVGTDGNLKLPAADGSVLGVLQQPGEGGSTMDLPVMVSGVSFVVFGSGDDVAAGADLSVDATGAVVTATTGKVVAKCLVGGKAGEIGCAILK